MVSASLKVVFKCGVDVQLWEMQKLREKWGEVCWEEEEGSVVGEEEVRQFMYARGKEEEGGADA
jgi:hypothetical protein